MPTEPPLKILFVCMGNICRSPTAHGLFQSLVDSAGLAEKIHVDSAGTHGYHIGAPPDSRSQATARSHGIDLSRLQARRFVSSDFHDFDYLIGMDRANLADMQAIRPEDATAQVNLMLDFASGFDKGDVPDPYFGEEGFDRVFAMIDDASRGFLRHLRSTHDI